MPLADELIFTLKADPPHGWSKGYVTISGRGDDKIAVEAMRRGAFAIHETRHGQWRLSHAPSGLQIWTFDRLDDVVKLAERIEPFTDWDVITEQLPSSGDLYPKVREAIDEIRPATDSY